MCGIVGAVAQRDVGEILLEGLKRLEYRGYDSAGISVIDHKNKLKRIRTTGKVNKLQETFNSSPVFGSTGIAHTRWATHGIPSESNAHPHQSGDHLALVHNGIIENYNSLRDELIENGYKFHSETDTETVVHLLHRELQNDTDFVQAVRNVTKKLIGAFSFGIINSNEPERIIAARYGSPLVIGLGFGENFIASDNLALLPVTQKFIFLEDGDIADITRNKIIIYDKYGKIVKREVFTSELTHEEGTLGSFRHFMLKEIFEQPDALHATLESALGHDTISLDSFGPKAKDIFSKVQNVQIAACGTSYNAGLTAKYWIEELAGISCQIEVASEFRYRKHVILPNTLFVSISQSGETADTLAALQQAKVAGYVGTLAISNVPESSTVRNSDLVFITRAGKEIGVAATKTFTAQLLALFVLALALAGKNLSKEKQKFLIDGLKVLPEIIKKTLSLDLKIKSLARKFVDKHNSLFLGRGIQYPIAIEGALKLKEISYIHAEAYPAGELKHGPLALVDKDIPIVVIAPNDELLEKLKSNLQEIRVREGQLIIFIEQGCKLQSDEGITTISMPKIDRLLTPITYVIPMQLLAYYVAQLLGTDVDHPRNLAKSVTVE